MPFSHRDDDEICSSNYSVLDEMVELHDNGLRTRGAGVGTHVTVLAETKELPEFYRDKLHVKRLENLHARFHRA